MSDEEVHVGHDNLKAVAKDLAGSLGGDVRVEDVEKWLKAHIDHGLPCTGSCRHVRLLVGDGTPPPGPCPLLSNIWENDN